MRLCSELVVECGVRLFNELVVECGAVLRCCDCKHAIPQVIAVAFLSRV